MYHSKKPENQLLSAKGDLILLGLAAISLFLLNWQIQMKLIPIAGITLILVSGYGLSVIFFPRKNDLSLLNRLIITPIFGIFLTGFWSIIINYTPYHNSNIYYELTVIPVLFLILIMRIAQFLKSGPILSSSKGKDKKLSKIKKFEEDPNLTTAQIAARAEKAKLMQITERNKKSEQINQFESPELESSGLSTSSPEPSRSLSPMPRPSKKKQSFNEIKGIENDNPHQKSKSESKTKTKTKWAFKSQNTAKNEKPSPENIEIIKIRNSSKDILIILFLTILSALFIFFPALKTSLIKIPFIIMLIFFIPGYSILCGLFVTFADRGIFKKLISSVLLSISLVMLLELLIIFLKIQISSSYILAALLAISFVMSVLGYLRRTKYQEKLKQGFNYREKTEIAEKSELNILTVTQARESSKNNLFNSNSNNSSLNKNEQKPLKNRNTSTKFFENTHSPPEESKSPVRTESIEPGNKNNNENNKIELKSDSENIDSNTILTPAEARKRVMSHKKARENLQKKNKKIKSSNVKANKLGSSEINLKSNLNPDNNNNNIPVKESEKFTKGLETRSDKILSPFKLIAVILLSLICLVFTITSITSLISSVSWGPLQLNSELIKLIFIIPILLYLPGYAIKELFIPRKYSGIIFTTAICIVISLSLDIITAFVLLYLSHFFTQINVTQSLYVGILSFISVSGILMGYWQSHHRNKNRDKNRDINKDRNENKITNEKKSSKIVSSLKSSEKDKKIENKSRIKVNEEKTLLQMDSEEKKAEKEVNQVTSLNENKKELYKKNLPETVPENQTKNISPNKKPLKTIYMEEELEKSFPSSNYFREESNNSKNISLRSPDLTKKRRPIAMDLLIILIITFLTIASIYIPIISDTPVREILGLLFVLFIPGYLLIAALFPKKQDLDIIARLALSFGLSLAISPLMGLILNYTPFGIKLTPIVIALSSFTIIMLIAAYIRRMKVAEEDRFQPNFSGYVYSLKSSFNKESRLDKVLSIILIITLVLAIATTAYIIVKPKEGEKFTEFYILGPDGKASNYPTNLTLGQSGKLFMGVVNHEYSTVNYEVVVKLQGKILSTEKITLKNNQKWEKPVIFTPDQSGSKQKLEFILYKLPDDAKPYRSLHLWINVV